MADAQGIFSLFLNLPHSTIDHFCWKREVDRIGQPLNCSLVSPMPQNSSELRRVVGFGIMGERLTNDKTPLGLLANPGATGAALVAGLDQSIFGAIEPRGSFQ